MLIEMEQGSTEWLDLRKTKITASDSCSILKHSPYKSMDALLDEKLGRAPEPICNPAMQRGTLLEPIARDLYCKEYGVTGKPTVHIGEEKKFGFFQLPTQDSDWAMCSTDLLCDDHDLVVEFKCGKLSFKQACREYIPDYYLCQIQHILWLTGRSTCHYCAFDGIKDLIVMEVKRNDEFIQEMIELEYEFYLRMQEERKKMEKL